MLLIKWYYLYFNIVYKNPQSTNPPKKQGIGGEFDEKAGGTGKALSPSRCGGSPLPEGAKKKSAGKARRSLASPSRTDSPDTGEVAHERQKGSGGPKGRKG